MRSIQNLGKKATCMKTVGDAMNFVKWLIDFVQMIFGWFNKSEDKDDEAAA